MKVYIETNFILELVFQQEQSESCEELLKLCEGGKIDLVIPAYSLVEPNEKLVRQAKERRELQQKLDLEVGQLVRAAPYAARIAHINDLGQLLTESNLEDRQRFVRYRERFLKSVEIILLTTEILSAGAEYELSLPLSPQDGVVLASITSYLKRNSVGEESCFLNQNPSDFDTPNIVSELAQYNCRMIYRFEHGLSYVQSRLL